MQSFPAPDEVDDTAWSAVKSDPRASLRLLLAEVTALANQLRRSGTLVPGQGDSLPAGWSILQAVGSLGPQTVPDIARGRGMSRQNIQILVNRLEIQGYVTAAPNPAHKRSGLVELTERGRQALATVMEQETASLEALLPYVSRSRLVPAARLLHQLRELLARKQLPAPETTGKALAPGTGRGRGPKAASHPRQRRRPGTPTAPAAELPAPAEPIELEEGELPVNLL